MCVNEIVTFIQKRLNCTFSRCFCTLCCRSWFALSLQIIPSVTTPMKAVEQYFRICHRSFWGNRNGEVVRAFASHQRGPGFDSRNRRHMWVRFVVGSHPCSERFFSGYSSFPFSSKTNISKFQFDLESESHSTSCQTAKCHPR